MSYNVYVAKLKNVRPHTNADRLQLGDCFGNTVCISKDYYEGMLGIYFPVDGQVSIEFGEINNLFRKKDENGKEVGGLIDAKKRNIKCIKLRGEKSDGLFLPLDCLKTFGDISALKEGDNVTIFNGHEIACKYIPVSNTCNNKNIVSNINKKKNKKNISPLFKEHKDTEQLAYNLNAFNEGDFIEITLKMHGTSGRTGYLPCLKGYKRTWKDKFLRREGKPIYEYDYVTGTRRVVLEDFSGGFYGNDEFRRRHSEVFKDKLHKGETIYYEIVGFTDNSTPIMPIADNKKLNDKDFIKQYGKETVFSYGCSSNGKIGIGITERKVPKSELYVYRMTMTNEDGDVVEYSPDFMRYRCEQMGVKTVPVLWQGIIPEIENDEALSEEYRLTPGDYIKSVAEQYYDGADPIGKIHIREGVVIRIVNKPSFTAFKHKNFNFKVLSNIAKLNVIDENKIENMSDDLISEI